MSANGFSPHGSHQGTRLASKLRLAIGLGLVSAVLAAGIATAASAATIEPLYGVTDPTGIAIARGGGEWFTEPTTDTLGYIAEDGTISRYVLPATVIKPTGIAVASDGSVWMTALEPKRLYERIVHRLTDGEFKVYKISSGEGRPWENAGDITEGPDGNIWFTVAGPGEIGRITPKGKMTLFPIPAPPEVKEEPYEITSGPDGALWFTEASTDGVPAIGRITTSGSVSSYPIDPARAGVPEAITRGPDGALWFTQHEAHQVGRITVSGSVSYFPLNEFDTPGSITGGADGALWFLTPGGVERMTTEGVGELSPFPVSFGLGQIVSASDGSLWFTDPSENEIGHVVTGATPPASYVALGDSYSSGEGNPPFEEGTNTEGETPDKCHRSAAAYGPLLDTTFHLGSMTFKACSGAVTNDIFATNATNLTEPAQLNWLGPDTKTVTLTIGGNDAGFPWVLEHCVAFPPLRLPDLACSANQQLVEETHARLSALSGGAYATTPSPEFQPIHSILSVIEAIHDHAHFAHIWVGLYPLLFGPSKTSYSDLVPGLGKTLGCEVGPNLWVSYKAALWLNKLGRQLDKIISVAVTKAQHKRIAVDPVTPSGFVGHGFCDEGERWFYPADIKVSHLLELEPEIGGATSSFHPTETGQRLGYEAAFEKAIG